MKKLLASLLIAGLLPVAASASVLYTDQYGTVHQDTPCADSQTGSHWSLTVDEATHGHAGQISPDCIYDAPTATDTPIVDSSALAAPVEPVVSAPVISADTQAQIQDLLTQIALLKQLLALYQELAKYQH